MITLSSRARGLLSFLAIYLVVGFIYCSIAAAIVPATNVYGRLYLMIIWPWMIAHGMHIAPSPPIPHWCFSFDGKVAQ